MPIVQCYLCSSDCYKTPKIIASRTHVFCSHKCHGEYERSKRPEANCICATCGKEFRTNPAYIRRRPNHRRFCSKQCFVDAPSVKRRTTPYIRSPKPHKPRPIAVPKPSEKPDSNGYIRMTGIPGREIREHRWFMEQKLGRKLERWEHVHHRNGIKTDNRLENLVVLDESAHHRRHRTPKGEGTIQTRCIGCGKEKWLARNYILNVYAGDESKAKYFRCGNCGGVGRRNYRELK